MQEGGGGTRSFRRFLIKKIITGAAFNHVTLAEENIWVVQET